MVLGSELLKSVFSELNEKVEILNQERAESGSRLISKAKVKLLGQMSLIANESVSAILELAQTGDLDAMLDMEHSVKKALQALLLRHGLVYDEDSVLIWIPSGARFECLFDFEHIEVNVIDPESALVSKAVKAPEKNKRLIRQAIMTGAFPSLVDRIIANGGDLNLFV